MAATALVRAQSPAAMSKSRRGGRARKRITYKEIGVGALGAVAGGAGSAVLVRWGLSPVWVSGTVTAVGAVGAVATKNNWRALFAGIGAGGGAMLAAAAAGAFPGHKKEGDPKQLEAPRTDMVLSAPAGAKNANSPRNAMTMTQQMRQQIAQAMRDVQNRQPVAA